LKFKNSSESAYTLIELGAVVVLLAIVSSFFISKFDLNTSWSSTTSIRELANRIEFLLDDASAKKVNYQIEFYPDGSGYRVWQIAKKVPSQTVEVDTLKNLRSTSQRNDRSNQSAANALKNIGDEFNKEQQIDLLPLNIQLYFQIFDDMTNIARRIAPLDYPSLVKGVNFPPNVRLKKITTGAEENSTSDLNYLPIDQSITGSDYQLQITTGDQDILLSIKPFERKVIIKYLNNA